MKIQNKTVWITGAGSGIGRALAQLVATKGGKCILSDINPESLSETVKLLPSEAVIHHEQVDVGNRSALIDHIASCIKNHGPVDIVINNAGTTLQPQTVNDSPYEDFEWLV